jgi:two-component system, LytTR family, response regulator
MKAETKFDRKLRAVLVDDEPSARSIVRKLLGEHFTDSISVTGEAKNILEARQLIDSVGPDLVFLDIEMPGGTGFDLLAQWQTMPFKVVFITAFDRFAIQAFRCAAIDYLLKPLDPNDFRNAVNRVLSIQTIALEQLEAFRVSLNHKKADRLVIPHSKGLFIFPLKDLLYIEADGNYCTIFSMNQAPAVVSRSIADLEEILPKEEFVRIHQSYIVNINEIVGLTTGDEQYVKLSNDSKVSISRRKRELIEAALLGRSI